MKYPVMSAALLFTFGSTALILTSNALRRLRRPRASFPPLWVPAMITTELAPLWLLVSISTTAALVAAGALDLAIGRIGAWLVAVSAAGLLALMGRSWRAIRRLEPHVTVEPPSASWPAILTGRPVETPPDLEQVDGIEYADGLTFDIVRSRCEPDDPAPVFVYVHGGGWTGGGPHKQARQMYHALAREGWVVVTPRYPLAPKASIREQVTNVKRAIAHIKSNAEAFRIDPKRVVLSGSSAGAHLAALAALTDPPLFQAGFEDDDTSVIACVPMYGIYDMANRRHTRPDWPYVDRDVMKSTYGDDPGSFHLVSPVDHVSADAPPFLVIHGTHDSLVPIAEADVFVSDLEAVGARVEFVRVHGAQHGFDAVSSPVSRAVAALVVSWCGRLVRDEAPSGR